MGIGGLPLACFFIDLGTSKAASVGGEDGFLLSSEAPPPSSCAATLLAVDMSEKQLKKTGTNTILQN